MAELPTPRAPDSPPVTAPDQLTLPSEGGAGYEVRDIRLRPIVYATAALVLGAIVAQVSTWLLFEYFAARELGQKASDRPLAGELRRVEPPEPRLQRTPLDDLDALRAWEQRLLTTYAVLDRQRGVVRIPIDRAMELVGERGLPARRAAVEPPAQTAPRPAGEAAEQPSAKVQSESVAKPSEKGPPKPSAKPKAGGVVEPSTKAQPRPATRPSPNPAAPREAAP